MISHLSRLFARDKNCRCQELFLRGLVVGCPYSQGLWLVGVGRCLFIGRELCFFWNRYRMKAMGESIGAPHPYSWGDGLTRQLMLFAI